MHLKFGVVSKILGTCEGLGWALHWGDMGRSGGISASTKIYAKNFFALSARNIRQTIQKNELIKKNIICGGLGFFPDEI